MNRVHVFQSVKGGVGCTTVATGFACWLASEYGTKVTVIGMNDDAKVTLNQNMVDTVEATTCDPFVLVSTVAMTDGPVVIDAGMTPLTLPSEWSKHLVTESHYVALRRAINAGDLLKTYDDMVVLHSPNGALTVADCAMVTKLPLFFSVERTPETARAVDAGLFPRHPGGAEEYRPVLVTA